MLKRKPSACFKALAFLQRMPLERVAPDTYAAFRISDVCVCVMMPQNWGPNLSS